MTEESKAPTQARHDEARNLRVMTPNDGEERDLPIEGHSAIHDRDRNLRVMTPNRPTDVEIAAHRGRAR